MLTNPCLTLTFLKNDISHSTTQEIDSRYLVKTVARKEQLFNTLKSASNQISLQITKECPSVADIIKTEGDVKAVLEDNSTVIFTGYLSTNFNWTVTENGEQALQVTIEDVGTRLLSKEFISNGQHLFDCSAMAAIEAVCEKAGVEISPECETLSGNVIYTVTSGATCKAILDQICYESGCVFYFDNLGQLRLFLFGDITTSGATLLDSGSLYSKGKQVVNLTKKIRQYKSVRIAYTAIARADNYLIYRNTSNQDESHQFCNIPLAPGEYFDGAEIYTYEEWQEQTLDEFREPTLIEACNAESEGSLVGSNEIVAISNVRKAFKASAGITCDITYVGGNMFKIVAHNSGNDTGYITQLDAYASIVYVKDNNAVRTSPDATVGSSDALLEEELQYVHTKEQAQAHANLVAQYHQFCNAQYTFQSSEDVPLGTVVELKEDTYSGLDVYVLLMSRNFTDISGIYQYQAVGISAFNLTKDVYYGTENLAKPGTLTQRVQVIEYAYGDADGPYQTQIGYNDDDIEDYVIVGYTEDTDEIVLGPLAIWGTDSLLPRRRGEYVWQRIGYYVPPQTEADISHWVISRLTSYDKSLEVSVDSEIAYRNERTPNETNEIKVDVKYSGFAAQYDIRFYVNTTSGALYAQYNRETAILTVPYNISKNTTQLIGVVTLTDTDGVEYESEVLIKIVDKTELGMVFGEVTEVPSGTTYVEDGIEKNYLKNDSKVFCEDEYSLTDDLIFVENEDYYKKVGSTYVLATDVQVGQPVTPNTYYVKTVKKTIYVFGGAAWDILNANYQGFEQVSLDNLPYIFADSRVKVADANGLKWIKNLVAQCISSVYYFVGRGGAIYSGAYNRDGSNPTNGKGLFIGADGTVNANGIDVVGNAYIHGNSIVGGTIINTYEYEVSGIHRETPVFKTNKSQSGNVTLDIQSKADTLAFNYSELPSAIRNYFASRMTKNTVLAVNNAYFCGRSVSHICYGQPTLPKIENQTMSNTGSTGSYNSVTITVPGNIPAVNYQYDLTAPTSENDSLFNSSAMIGQIWLYLTRGGQTTNTQINKGGSSLLFTYSLEHITGTLQLQAGDVAQFRFYGCRCDGRDKYVTNYNGKVKYIKSQEQIGDPNELNLFKDGVYLGTPASIIAGLSGYCTNLTTGFVNMHPTTGWTGATPMTLNGSNWNLPGVKQFYKMKWNSTAPSREVSVSTFSASSTIVHNGTTYHSADIISITASASAVQFIVLKNQGSTQEIIIYNLNSYNERGVGAFRIQTESPEGLLGAYGLNMMPINDYDPEAIDDPSQAGNVGTADDPWTIGFAMQGWQQGSARILKENIEPFEDRALEILNKTQICQFFYKGTKGDQRYLNVGFIADDTDELLATPKHNVQATGSCIGVLIKAIQELSQEIERLKEGK